MEPERTSTPTTNHKLDSSTPATTLQGTPSTSSHNTPQHPSEQPREKGSNESFLMEIFKFAVIALVIVIPFRMFIAQPFIVSGASMSPTFETGQYLIIDQLSYHFDDPQRGDVIIFRFPEDTSKFFIKRVIGLPGETVELEGTDVVIIDRVTGERTRLEEPYVAAANLKDDFQTIELRNGEYFVMGDNRSASSDSRIWGPVPERMIVGRAFVRLLPASQFETHPGDYRAESEQETE